MPAASSGLWSGALTEPSGCGRPEPAQSVPANAVPFHPLPGYAGSRETTKRLACGRWASRDEPKEVNLVKIVIHRIENVRLTCGIKSCVN
jgi:hypothetical protein